MSGLVREADELELPEVVLVAFRGDDARDTDGASETERSRNGVVVVSGGVEGGDDGGEEEADENPSIKDKVIGPKGHKDTSETTDGAEEEEEHFRSVYLSRLLLVLQFVLVASDHITDWSVLYDLWEKWVEEDGELYLFFVGLMYDLLPGPVTALQFLALGYPL